MKKSISKRFTATILALAMTSLILAGCSKSDPASSSASGGEGVSTIKVGTGTAYKPYCYLDDDGNLAGYEYEVLKAIDELLPQYEFTFETFDFKNILLSLDSSKIDIGAHQFEQNEDRIANYLFGEESYTTFIRYIVVSKDRDDIKTIDDLAGKKVYASPGDNATWLFEEYNKAHPDDPIILDIVEGISTDERVAGIKNGKWDAYSATRRDVEKANKDYGDVEKTVGEPILSSLTYFVFKKGNTQLQQDVDGALKTLKENGKLSQISIDVIGGDYTTEE